MIHQIELSVYSCCFLVRSDVKLVKIISDLINADIAQEKSSKNYWLLSVPRLVCYPHLETFSCVHSRHSFLSDWSM